MSPGLASINQIAKSHRRDWDEGDTFFRGVAINVVLNEFPTIDWKNGQNRNQKANVELLPRDYVTIRVLKDQIESAPVAGEVFTQGTETKHRVQEVVTFKLSWLCLCKSSTTQ